MTENWKGLAEIWKRRDEPTRKLLILQTSGRHLECASKRAEPMQRWHCFTGQLEGSSWLLEGGLGQFENGLRRCNCHLTANATVGPTGLRVWPAPVSCACARGQIGPLPAPIGPLPAPTNIAGLLWRFFQPARSLFQPACSLEAQLMGAPHSATKAEHGQRQKNMHTGAGTSLRQMRGNGTICGRMHRSSILNGRNSTDRMSHQKLQREALVLL